VFSEGLGITMISFGAHASADSGVNIGTWGCSVETRPEWSGKRRDDASLAAEAHRG